ncbi:MAG: hypothetical protein Q8R31_01530 [Candidatus Omnitrophota bacterium]|nr:hypothetical protein [Candidatus Omnitrophota bacterium]
MQNKKLLLLIALSIIAVFSLFYGMFTPSRTERNLITKDTAIQKTIVTEKGIISLTRGAKRSNYSSWGRNPFSISGAPIRRLGALTINGILWDKKNPLAIINEEIVKVGDKIDGNTVVGIKQDRVILNDGSKDTEFLLGQ